MAVNGTGWCIAKNNLRDQGILPLHHCSGSSPQKPLRTLRSGVREGCVLSPILFNYVTGWVLGKTLQEHDSVGLASGRWLTDLDYADDIALLASSFGDLQYTVVCVKEVQRCVMTSNETEKAFMSVLSVCR
ncbi:unnamed protein product [Dibothriocephalus latus]|uniref:Reverse transcriptase domain-containing protein n=1 Tax=Dibothriocephalus latus TaxID=60516 RepID=A0A3P7N036_DIBLA|nr:unnamed protein product [Dibothriocephalus latus]